MLFLLWNTDVLSMVNMMIISAKLMTTNIRKLSESILSILFSTFLWPPFSGPLAQIARYQSCRKFSLGGRRSKAPLAEVVAPSLARIPAPAGAPAPARETYGCRLFSKQSLITTLICYVFVKYFFRVY